MPGRSKFLAAAFLVGAVLALAAACGGSAGPTAAGPAPDRAARTAASLSPAHLVGSRIVTGFPETLPPAELRAMIRRGELAGAAYYAWNVPSRDRARRSVAALERIRRRAGLPLPLLAMTDQEGGLVKRISGAPSASARLMGTRGAGFARRQGRRTAANLRDVGFNVDLAPVLDVPRPGGDIDSTDRGFSTDPGRVARVGVAFAAGLRAGRVAATAKHFPGIGAARLSTDLHVQEIGLSRSTLRRVDERPFRDFIAAGGDLVMLSTAIYPALSSRPAAFSRAIVTGELRRRLGFEGVAVTDALETGAVRGFGDTDTAAVAAVRAGADLLFFTNPATAGAAHAALLSRLRSGALDRGEFERSAARVLRLRERLAGWGRR